MDREARPLSRAGVGMHPQRAEIQEIGSAAGAGQSSYGEGYLEWKGWDPSTFASLRTREAADFRAILRKTKTRPAAGAAVLEIGFGNGTFLEYGRRRGWQMHGTEVNAGLVKRAREQGFAAEQCGTLAGIAGEAFDLVAAFDVMEHIPLEELPGFLQDVRRVLRSGGSFLARVPNGDSPLGRHLQNGDVTHRTAIGSIRARYLAVQAGFEVMYIGMEPQAVWAGAAHTPHRLFAVPMRKLLNAFMNVVYSPRDPLPFGSPNLVIALRKPSSDV